MESLENTFLIAMPSMDGSFFNKSVIYLCEHNDEGAMGLIVNLPISLSINELLKQIDTSKSNLPTLSAPVLSGGPVSPDRGFVLHSSQSGWNSSLALNDSVMITTSKDILMALGTERSPEKFIITLGYAGWSPGQLEQEIADNFWLTAPASNDVLFDTPIEQRWQKANEIIGIDPAHLSIEIGHA